MSVDTFVKCPGCGLNLSDRHLPAADRFNTTGECWQVYCELTCYTLTKEDSTFIHQHVVDAYEAQHAGGATRPITVVFGLIGLYLALEKGYTGRQVQLAHMKIGRRKREWPRLEPPEQPAELTVLDVAQATAANRDEIIMRWTASVWKSWDTRHEWVRKTTERVLYEEDR